VPVGGDDGVGAVLDVVIRCCPAADADPHGRPLLPDGRPAPACSALLNGGYQGQRELVGRRADEHLVQHDVVQHLQAPAAQAGGHRLGMPAGPADEVGHAPPAERAKHRPYLDLPGPL